VTDAKPEILVIDDDSLTAEIIVKMLQPTGAKVSSTTNSVTAYEKILETRPDCIICDLMMPEVDGLNLLKRIRETEELKTVKFIMVTAKAYEFDQKRAFEFGANGYIRKPLNVETFAAEVERVLNDEIDMTFWGVRGTLPASGEETLKYGGNTSCVSLEFPRRQFFIFDGGSGIKRLGDSLMRAGRKRIQARIFISHPHWDHINAIPFFAPLYIPGNEFQILGANQGDVSMRELISAQMDGVYFPITLSEFGSISTTWRRKPSRSTAFRSRPSCCRTPASASAIGSTTTAARSATSPTTNCSWTAANSTPRSTRTGWRTSAATRTC
jgi:CheY-like chemotaxis protein